MWKVRKKMGLGKRWKWMHRGEVALEWRRNETSKAQETQKCHLCNLRSTFIQNFLSSIVLYMPTWWWCSAPSDTVKSGVIILVIHFNPWHHSVPLQPLWKSLDITLTTSSRLDETGWDWIWSKTVPWHGGVRGGGVRGRKGNPILFYNEMIVSHNSRIPFH